jgi:hypothetical protein
MVLCVLRAPPSFPTTSASLFYQDATGVTFQGAGFKRSSEKFVGYGVETWKLD